LLCYAHTQHSIEGDPEQLVLCFHEVWILTGGSQLNPRQSLLLPTQYVAGTIHTRERRISGSFKWPVVVTLPKRSPQRVLLTELVRKTLINVTIVVDPLRSIVRDRLLRKLSSAPQSIDSHLKNDPPVLLLMVYRTKNAPMVEAFLRQVDPNADVRLWALDEIAPELALHTIGSGPGTRFNNFNKLYNAKPIEEGSWVVLADDDVLFVRGDLTRTIGIMKEAGLSLAQPTQSILGWWTFPFNVARPFLVARDSNYVEQGPLLVIDPSFAELILPLPDTNDMGWGIEADWYRAKEGRYRIGLIDDCRVLHYARAGSTYSYGPETRNMDERLRKAGVDSLLQLQSVNGYWWKWQRTPSWGEI